MDCIYIALSQTQWPPKHFTFASYSLTDSYTNSTAVSAMHHPAHQEQLGLGVLLMDNSTLGRQPTWTTEPLPPTVIAYYSCCPRQISQEWDIQV